MKRAIIIVVCLLMALSMVGAAKEQTEPIKIWGQNENGCYYTLIVVDDETGVNYIVVSTARYSTSVPVAITPRLNADGTLYISK